MKHIRKIGGIGMQAKKEALRIYLDTYDLARVAVAMDVSPSRAREMIEIGHKLKVFKKTVGKNPFEGVSELEFYFSLFLWEEGCLSRVDVRDFLQLYGESLLELHGVGRKTLACAYRWADLEQPLWLKALFDTPIRVQLCLDILTENPE